MASLIEKLNFKFYFILINFKESYAGIGLPTWVDYLEIIQTAKPLELDWVDYFGLDSQQLENITVMMNLFTQYNTRNQKAPKVA